ncbi:type II toxin-antitoxin system VapC family toxin [Sphingomonas lenta]|uniref:PIN domain nuclease n=1 Tax=Sphingomonas lenta TaxID=1141887 RepID=A0A2A2SDB4_9SPHN|nr:type II toxin-antitoxin system VapC family toxin [Sphingomonas lenta]PAX07246.1 PIN domain nuclease [Sphingomonas lenta]
MKLLLDTHALLWWLLDDPRLTRRARAEIAAPMNDVFVSSISAMELATKFRIGKLPEAAMISGRFVERIALERFQPLPIALAHADAAGLLAIPHRDPFDRFLIAQAIVDDMELVSNEERFDAWGVRRLW